MRAKIAIAGIVFIVVCTFFSLSFAGTNASEYELKAEFVWRFTLFVDWPDSQFKESSDPFLIGIIGASPVTEQLVLRTQGQFVDTRPVLVRTLEVKSLDRDTNIADCEMIFISKNADSEIAEILKFTDGRPILTVAEKAGSAELGALINLYLEGDKVRIEINQTAAHKSGLGIGSKLFKVARIVGGGGD